MIHQAKKLLREKIKTFIESLSKEEQMQQTKAVFSRLENVKQYNEAKTVMLFWSFGKEIFTHDFVNMAYQTKEVLLPVIDGENLLIKPYTGIENMAPEPHFGILEPQGKAILDARPDLIIVPGLAFDAACNRLGRGKAYYDKLFSSRNTRATLIGVGYNEQIVGAVPVDDHDKQLDMVITPEKIYYRKM